MSQTYPTYPATLSAESAYAALDGPSDQVLRDLLGIIASCAAHAAASPSDWDGSHCAALETEASSYAAELA